MSGLQLVWLRQDLRLDDNPALEQAAKKGTVICLYIEASKQHQAHDESAAKQSFRLASLQQLKLQLNALNIPLIYLEVDYFEDMAAKLEVLVDDYSVEALHFNGEYPLNEKLRDEQVLERLKDKIAVHSYHGDLAIAPSQLKTLQGHSYRVFTPYKKAWIKQFVGEHLVLAKSPKKQSFDLKNVKQNTIHYEEAYRQDLWPAGYLEAQKRLDRFEKKILGYADNRDFPAINGTSGLSPYLAIGAISVKQCIGKLMREQLLHGDFSEDDLLGHVWLSELIWREFYRQILIDNCESLSKHQAFKDKPENWIYGKVARERFEAWKNAKTGFPLIDAAMLQLKQTGWMHNRLRMLTAMFLTKLCLVDWRWGEQYFMQQLIDGDFASNNGGWQWCASTGADAAPYFRIMNPITQSKKFDSEGSFIKKFLPELADLDSKAIHFPNAEQRKSCGYPEPIIDYPEARKEALRVLA